MNAGTDMEKKALRPTGIGTQVLLILVALVPLIVFLYPIIAIVSFPFSGTDEPAVVDPSHAFSQLTGWSFPNSASVLENTNSHSGFKNDGDYVLVVRMPSLELQSLIERDRNIWLDCPVAPQIASSAWSLPVHSGTKYYAKKTSESDTDWHRGHVVIVNPDAGMVWIYEWKI
jgi:hypothetical protein